MKIEIQKNGTIIVNHLIGEKRNKIRVKKDKIEYTYNHTTNNSIIPLQHGKGNYKIDMLEQINGTQYRIISSHVVMNNYDDNSVFLCPNKIVNYSENSVCIKDLKNIKRDDSIIDNIIGIIRSKLEYDLIKAKNIDSYRVNGEYIPDIDSIYNTGKGICYDYAVIFASMLRYSGIPCKVIFGYIQNGLMYHAWNEVFNGNAWVRYDITLEDAGIKNYSDYNDKYFY